jgi:hypothetical protein
MMPIPEMNDVDSAFSNAKHLPKYDKVPERFKSTYDPYVKFISTWFFNGKTKAEIESLISKEGVDKNKALRAIAACLKSWEPKHEHKEAGCAYMLADSPGGTAPQFNDNTYLLFCTEMLAVIGNLAPLYTRANMDDSVWRAASDVVMLANTIEGRLLSKAEAIRG